MAHDVRHALLRDLEATTRVVLDASCVPSFPTLAPYLARSLARGDLSASAVRELPRVLSQGLVPDYSRFAAAFAYHYFGVNYAKVRRAAEAFLQPLRSVDALRIVDIGAGTGASTLACVHAAQSLWPDISVTVDVVDIDRAQLDAFRSVVAPLLKAVGVPVEMRRTDALSALRPTRGDRDGATVVLASFVVCEMTTEDGRELLAEVPKLLRGKDAFIVLEPDSSGSVALEVLRRRALLFEYVGELPTPWAAGLGLPLMPKNSARARLRRARSAGSR